jgi:hypothetical protein
MENGEPSAVDEFQVRQIDRYDSRRFLSRKQRGAQLISAREVQLAHQTERNRSPTTCQELNLKEPGPNNVSVWG